MVAVRPLAHLRGHLVAMVHCSLLKKHLWSPESICSISIKFDKFDTFDSKKNIFLKSMFSWCPDNLVRKLWGNWASNHHPGIVSISFRFDLDSKIIF